MVCAGRGGGCQVACWASELLGFHLVGVLVYRDCGLSFCSLARVDFSIHADGVPFSICQLRCCNLFAGIKVRDWQGEAKVGVAQP